jgi:outer membrane receptor protein involved in Fe transport
LSDYGWKLPSAKSGIGVLFGLERRVEKLNLETDTAFTTGDLFGQGGPTIGLGGKYDVTDVFLETRVPILEGAPMAEVLALNGSYRRSDYSTGNKSDTFGFGAEWAPNKLVRLRASAQRAVRAPNVIELFTARGLSLFDIANDPCGAGGTATIEQCRRTGLPDTLFRNAFLNSPAGQYNFLGGGNPNLSPEESDSATLGLVLTPIRNMSIAFDYFSVEVEKVIGIIPPLTILNQCLEGNTALCAFVQRDRFGSLWATPQGFITSGNQNLGGLSTKGIDVEINYAMKIGRWGGLKFNFNGTKLMENITEPVPGLGSFDCAGLHGLICRVPSPEWRHKLRTTWETPWNVDISATWRHIASVSDQGVSEAPQLRNAILADKDRTLGQRDYLDISASWQATKQLALRGGINNVFDRDPPLSGLVPTGFGNGNTYPQMYDSLGRRIFVNATYKF